MEKKEGFHFFFALKKCKMSGMKNNLPFPSDEQPLFKRELKLLALLHLCNFLFLLFHNWNNFMPFGIILCLLCKFHAVWNNLMPLGKWFSFWNNFMPSGIILCLFKYFFKLLLVLLHLCNFLFLLCHNLVKIE